MREINGFVCRAKFDNRELLFGKNRGKGTKNYQNFETNNLTPYDSLREASNATFNICEIRGVMRVDVQKIEMRIADKLGEYYLFKNEKSLVIVEMADFGETNLRGPLVESDWQGSSVPGAPLRYTHFKTFDSFDRAEYVAQEVRRQGQMQALMATFSLEDIT